MHHTLSTSRRFLACLVASLASVGTIEAAAAQIRLVFTHRVAARATQEWQPVVPWGDRHLEIEGDEGTDLDCFVYDEGGNLLAQDIDLTDYCILPWRQARTGPVRVRIQNLGPVYNEYELRLR